MAKVQAEEIYRCWDMMGQGKLNIFPNSFFTNFGFNDVETGCVICSRVAIDNNIKGIEDIIGKVDVNKYMNDMQVPGKSETFTQAMSGGAFNSFKNYGEGEIEKAINDPKNKGEVINLNLNRDSTEKAILFSQRNTEIGALDAVNNIWTGIAGVAGGTVLFGGTKVVKAGVRIIGMAAKSPGALVTIVVAAAGISGAGAYGAWQNQQTSVGYCGALSGGVGNKEKLKMGCSVTSSVPYNPKNINALCEYIDGNL